MTPNRVKTSSTSPAISFIRLPLRAIQIGEEVVDGRV